MRRAALIVLLGLVMTTVTGTAAVYESATSRSLEFDVYLDDNRIGFHRFEFERPADGTREVRSKANFDVKFLFFTAFKYRHSNEELWSDGCLTEIHAETNSNGKRTEVVGEQTDAGFVVETGDGRSSLAECVMTFAYWNPEFLEQQKLLNAQTGEYLDVQVERLDDDSVQVNGKDVEAVGYIVQARDVEVRVWYADDEWIALESPAKGGRVLRYEIS